MIIINTSTWYEYSNIQLSVYSQEGFLRRLDGNVINGSEQASLSRKTIELMEDYWYFDTDYIDTPNTEIVIVKSPIFSDLKDSFHHTIAVNCLIYLRRSKSISEDVEAPPKNNLRSNKMSTIGNGVIVKTSNIPNAGLGLFATRDFEKNEPITFMDGKIIDRNQALKLRQEKKATHIGMTLRSEGPH